MIDTSIRISRRTNAQLDLHKRENESYDELLQRLTESKDKRAGFGALAEGDPEFDYDPEAIDELREATRERMQERIVSSLVLYETYIGVLYGYVPDTPDEVLSIVNSTMALVTVTEQTANESARLQQELLKIGASADQPDGLIAASAREHGAALATADEMFRNDEVEAVLDVVRYHRE